MRIEKKSITSKRPPSPPKPKKNKSITSTKEKEIDEIYSLWSGGFINSDDAMISIGKVLESIEINDVSIIDSEGETLIKFDKAFINISRS